MNRIWRTSIALFLIVGSMSFAGCSKFLPSIYGEGALFGKAAKEDREKIYGHIYIKLPDGFTMIGGPIKVVWRPVALSPELNQPQYLTSTFYEYDDAFYITQWTKLDTDKFYFVPLPDEKVSRWGTKWQERKYTVSSKTTNQEYIQYFDYMRRFEKDLSDVFTITVYAKRFSGRVLIRVLEFVPVKSVGGKILQFQELYPLAKYKTVEIPDDLPDEKSDNRRN